MVTGIFSLDFSILTNISILTENDKNDADVAHLFLNFWSNGHRWGCPSHGFKYCRQFIQEIRNYE